VSGALSVNTGYNSGLTKDMMSGALSVNLGYNSGLTKDMMTGALGLASSNTTISSLSNLGTVGTITSGTWSGTTIAVANGGTGQTTYTNGELLIGNTTGNTLTKNTLTAGSGISITNGTGSITISSNVPNGTSAGDMLYWTGSAWVKVEAGTDGQTLTFSNGAPTWLYNYSSSYDYGIVSTVTNVSTGKIWMDRNLGAKRVALSISDVESYGDLYQWGRGTDGHEKRTSSITNVLSNKVQPDHGKFIISSSTSNWLSTDNVNLWQGKSGVNNPCPNDFRIPTRPEWDAEISSWSAPTAAAAFSSPLKLTLTGGRNSETPSSEGEYGHYWTSLSFVMGPAYEVSFCLSCEDPAQSTDNEPKNGFSVRCIKD
jgi:uncharacterized protein (TIGR02145 family)